jgi:hypothetical protein
MTAQLQQSIAFFKTDEDQRNALRTTTVRSRTLPLSPVAVQQNSAPGNNFRPY